MNRQALFDQVVTYARTGKKSEASDGQCQYRLDKTPNCPTRCFMGVLIPDEIYDPKMDRTEISPEHQLGVGIPASNLLDEFPQLAKHLGVTDIKQDGYFLNQLQEVHDRHESTDWIPALEKFAARWSLNFPTT